jgi:hypothetical protein
MLSTAHSPLRPLSAAIVLLSFSTACWAGEGAAVFGIPVDFILFALTLLGVALFHHHTLRVALIGLATITLYKLGFSDFHGVAGFAGLGGHLVHEWVTIANLLGLLLGFAVLARHFEESGVPHPSAGATCRTTGRAAFVLLVMVFVLSSFLDNIAAALIGGTVAVSVFHGKVHVGYVAAIVAAANAGGSGSVIGDTTTTMMWIDGVDPAWTCCTPTSPRAWPCVVSACRPRCSSMPSRADRQNDASPGADRLVRVARHRRR